MNIFREISRWPWRFQQQHGQTYFEKSLYLIWHRTFDALVRRKVLWPNGQIRFTTQRKSVAATANKQYEKLVCLTGFGHSGSGAVLDLLSEYDNVTAKGFIDADGSARTCEQADAIECVFAPLAGGIWTLEKILPNGSMQEMDAFIKLFLAGISSMYNPSSTVYGEAFLNAAREFMDGIVDYCHTDSMGYEYCPHLHGVGENGFRCLYGDDAKMGIFKMRELSIKEYRQIASRFIRKIISLIPSNRILVLDQALSDGSADMEKYIDYFGELKLIAVYRDPRDVYVTARTLGISWIPPKPEDFIKMYNCYGIIDKYLKLNHPNFLMLRFEDVVNDYETSVRKVEQFIDLDAAAHKAIKQAFDPARSQKNIGIHARHPEYAKETEMIGRELRRFCYNPA